MTHNLFTGFKWCACTLESCGVFVSTGRPSAPPSPPSCRRFFSRLTAARNLFRLFAAVLIGKVMPTTLRYGPRHRRAFGARTEDATRYYVQALPHTFTCAPRHTHNLYPVSTPAANPPKAVLDRRQRHTYTHRLTHTKRAHGDNNATIFNYLPHPFRALLPRRTPPPHITRSVQCQRQCPRFHALARASIKCICVRHHLDSYISSTDERTHMQKHAHSLHVWQIHYYYRQARAPFSRTRRIVCCGVLWF